MHPYIKQKLKELKYKNVDFFIKENEFELLKVFIKNKKNRLTINLKNKNSISNLKHKEILF
jgi:hypothetical protein